MGPVGQVMRSSLNDPDHATPQRDACGILNSDREIAETLGVTERTVQRDWEKARAILAAALK